MLAKKGRQMANNGNHKKKIPELLPNRTLYSILVIFMALVGVAFLAMTALVDAIPFQYIKYAIGALFVMLILADILLARKQKVLRIIGLTVAFLFLAVYGLGTYYLGTTYAMFARISSNNSSEAEASGVDISKESFNIYLTGIDQWNKEKVDQVSRSDVNMIITVNPQTRKVLLTSIPRDAYVKLHTAQQMDKLTHTGVYGVDETINTVQDWLGVDLNYYVKMNFSAVRDVIDAMGGIDVNSPVAFGSSISNYTYEKGVNHLNGKAALFFARERKAFEGKDDIRVENQQRVVKAVIDKMTSSTTLLTKYGDILGAAGKSLETNMSNKEMQSLVRMQLEDLGEWDIKTQKITGEYGMDYVASLSQANMYQVYRPSEESVKKCLSNIDKVLNPTQEEIEEIEAERELARQKRFEEKQKNTAVNFLKKIFGGNDDAAKEAADEEAEG